MPVKANNKYIILVFLLLCSWFLTCYISVSHTNGIIPSDIFDIFSHGGRNDHSSMNGGANTGYNDFIAVTDTSTAFFIFSMKKSRWLSTKNSFNFLTAIVTAQVACLSYYSKLSDETYTQLSSSIITAFLHKKDGMK